MTTTPTRLTVNLSNFRRTLIPARAFALAVVGAFSLTLSAAPAPPVTVPDDRSVIWQRQRHHMDDTGDTAAKVRQLIELSRRQGDLRALGQAQALLDDASLPQSVEFTVLRAVIAQRNHEFDDAQTLLLDALSQDPTHAQANFTLYNVALVQGNIALARSACTQLRVLGYALIERSCHYNLMSMTGDAVAARLAFEGLHQVLRASHRSLPIERAWASATLAELAATINHPGTERFYRQALSLAHHDHYSAASLADWYLNQGRPAAALAILDGRPRSDRLDLLRLIAYRQLNSPAAATLQEQLEQRFQAAKIRDSELHLYEQARFLLDVAAQPKAALRLAERNFAQQKERADRVLLERARQATAQSQ